MIYKAYSLSYFIASHGINYSFFRNLYYNEITHLDVGIFDHLSNLRVLYV